METIEITEVSCEYRINPIGIDCPRPRFGWKLASGSRAVLQGGYRIQVSTEEEFARPLWDTGRVESGESVLVPYDGPALRPSTRYHVRVKVWDRSGNESPWSGTFFFETGLMDPSAWQADWITPDGREIDGNAEPAFLMRRPFRLEGRVARARIYASAAGAYELRLNGRNISEDVLAPGWTSFHTRIQYQTHDVTDLLREGENVVGAVVGDGWYRSGMGNAQKNYRYGDRRAFIAQLYIRYADGREEVIATDGSWKASLSAIRYSTIYHGEIYDARLEQDGWDAAGFDDSGWARVETVDLPKDVLTAQENEPIRVTERLAPVRAFTAPSGGLLLDMGQNMVGRIRMTLDVPAGTRIVLRHAEVLDREGNPYFGNLRTAKARVEYIAKGVPGETYAPHFTFMGFRYVRIETEGPAPVALGPGAFTGEVLHSDMVPTGTFECSDERVNRLFRNIVWGQRGNFVDVPTDCPQRDERLGWTGDAQIFIRTALYNYLGANFFAKWLRDLKADQMPDGGVPMVVPDVEGSGTSAGWGDAATICPWAVYEYYGDKRVLEEQYDSMKRWVAYMRGRGEDEFLWKGDFHTGDWLALDGSSEDYYIGATPVDFIASAYYAHSTRIVRDAAEVLGYEGDRRYYDELYRKIVEAFRREYVTEAGLLACRTQTAYAVALAFDLLEPRQRPRAVRDLHSLVVDRGFHLDTGFVGTPYLCLALSEHGYHGTAVKLFLQDDYPGWLYSVAQGATTIWEHWDGIKEDGSFWSDNMNSFNHYAYGAIGEWMYRKIAGIEPLEPGFRRIRIAPLFGMDKLAHAGAVYRSVHGEIAVRWEVSGFDVALRAEIPPNTTAEVRLKGARIGEVRIDGGAPEAADGVLSVASAEDGVVLEIGSGRYAFAWTVRDRAVLRPVFTMDSRLDEICCHEKGGELVRSRFPWVSGLGFMLKKATLRQLAGFPLAGMTEDDMRQFLDELNAM